MQVLKHSVVRTIALCTVILFAVGAVFSLRIIAQYPLWQLSQQSRSSSIRETHRTGERDQDVRTESGKVDQGEGTSDRQLSDRQLSDRQLQIGGHDREESDNPNIQQAQLRGSDQYASNPLLSPDTGTQVSSQDPRSEGWDNSIAVCAIMKQERVSDVLEWLLYHRWLGVDKIYLRENKNSTFVSDQYREPFQYLIDEGFLSLATWPGQSPEAQQLWYNRCAQGDLAGAQAWILFSDLDEFPVLLNGGVAEEEPDLKAFMRRQRGAAGLSLQWVMFGSSGLRDRPSPGGPLRHFVQCSDELSFEMKCFAASHYLAEKPFIGPGFVHSCCYRYDANQDPDSWPPLLYGDGSEADFPTRIQRGMLPPMSGSLYDRPDLQTSRKCRTYRGHLLEEDHKNNRDIPQGQALVLFHYMTRSFQDFRERKLSRYAGMYVDDFKERRAAAVAKGGSTPPDEELFDDLEHALGLDYKAPVCSSAADAGYAAKCCE